MKQKFVEYYMRLADETAKLSSAVRLQVGSVIVRDQQILATGYNGTPTGWDNNCEDIEWCSAGGWLSPEEIEQGWPYEGTYTTADGHEMRGRYRLKTKPEVLHAESNALMKIARSTESSDGAAMFCTHAPCLECAKLIYQSGIKKLYYRDTYRDFSGVEFLQKGNVDVEQYNSNKS
jgi:dCMP deaminase